MEVSHKFRVMFGDLNPGLADSKFHALYCDGSCVPALWGQGLPSHSCPHLVNLLSSTGLLGSRRVAKAALHSPQACWRVRQPDCPAWPEHWDFEC